MVNWIIFSSILQIWYIEVRISRSISESPLEFDITRVDCRLFHLADELIFIHLDSGVCFKSCILWTSGNNTVLSISNAAMETDKGGPCYLALFHHVNVLISILVDSQKCFLFCHPSYYISLKKSFSTMYDPILDRTRIALCFLRYLILGMYW